MKLFFISNAYASSPVAPPTPSASSLPDAAAAGTGGTLMANLVMVLVLVLLFYVLMIMPQQKRFKAHTEMINALKKGDRVLLMSGFIGRIDSIQDGNSEVVIDLGNNMKVTVVRSAIQGKADEKAA